MHGARPLAHMTGQQLGHYRILEKIGAGAMGEVFRARDERLGRDVAIKLIRPASGDNPDHLRRFEQEARAAAALNHPNILAIFDVGFEGATPYIVSELLEGETLRQRLAQGAIPTKHAAELALQITHGLVAAHERRIVHRDLKPENLFLTSDGRIKILDFGVAKLQLPPEDQRAIENLTTVTKSGAVIGTVAYMSPEQLRSKAVDHRSDIFSLGAILYEMLAGQRAFQGETEVDTMTAVLREEPAEANLEQAAIPGGFRDVVRHCLEKDPDNRFQSAKDLAFALQTLSGTSPGSRIELPRRPRLSRLLPWAATALLAIAALLLAIFPLQTTWQTPTYRRLTFEAGTIYSARFADEGNSILYSAAWNDKPIQLFSTVGNSLLTQPLNFSGATLLGVSPSGELAVVLKGTRTGQLEVVDGVLARAPLAGGSPREVLSDVRWADWDKSGQLAVVHYADGHCRLEYPIGTVLYQSKGWISHIRFSPKYDKIAFMDHPNLWDMRGSVMVTDTEGHARAVTGEWESEQGVAWHASGKEIWFTAVDKGNNLTLKAVTLSGKMRTILNLPTGMTLEDLAADGRALVTLNAKRLALAYSTLGAKEDTELSWHDWNVAKDISRDGRFVLFEDSSEAAGPGYAVVLRKLDESLPERLGEGSAGHLSPDGTWAIAIATGATPQVTLLPTGQGQPRRLAVTGLERVQNGFGRFLENGKAVVVNANEAGHAPRCYLLALSGAKPTPLTPEGVYCGPTSLDNRFMISSRPSSANGGGAIQELYPLAGGAPKPVNISDPDFHPVEWSLDGRFLFGYRPGEMPSKVYKVEISTGKESFVQQLRPGSPAGVVSIAPVIVSPTGNRFIYSYNETISVLYLISGLK